MDLRIVVTALALVTLTACGGSDREPDGSPSTVVTREASPDSAPEEKPLPCVPGTEPFTGPAAERFGAERVMAAYCMLADVAEGQTRTSLALPVPEQRARDVDRLRRLLTDRAGRDWSVLVAERRQGPSRLDGLTLHDVRQVPRGFRRADDLPHVFRTRVGPATAGLVDGGEALRLTFTLETNLVLERRGDDSGRHLLLPVAREATYVLVPHDEGGRWSIDRWEAEFEHGEVGLVSG